MKLGICAQVLYDLPFDEALATAAAWGVEAIELPVDARNPFVDLDAALAGGSDLVADAVREAGLEISALSNHQEGQLLLGPHGSDTDPIHEGSPEQKSAFARRRLADTARLAARMGVDTVITFSGCEDYSRWFPWPVPDGYERMGPRFREEMLPLLDLYGELGVQLTLECHPRQLAYNLETALWAVELVDGHEALAFNLDPANLLLAGMDPCDFVAELGHRIRHVHAKDGESVRRHAGRSGLLAHGPWDRPGRGFRFRVPGWGDIDWRELITELQLAGYGGVLAIEHEDPTMSRRDGIAQAVAHLQPLLLRDPPEPGWW